MTMHSADGKSDVSLKVVAERLLVHLHLDASRVRGFDGAQCCDVGGEVFHDLFARECLSCEMCILESGHSRMSSAFERAVRCSAENVNVD